MKIAIVGDLHIGARNNNVNIMHNQTLFFRQLIQYVNDNNIKDIVILGDQFDNRRSINHRALDNAYSNLFDVLAKSNIAVHVLVGNHDLFWAESTEIDSNSLLLRQYCNVIVYNKPKTVTFDQKTFDFIPWLCNENRQQCLDYIASSVSDYCVGHFEVNQFQVMPGVEFANGLSRDVFKNYKRVFTGHFHQASEKENITYVGTPYQLTWSDYNVEKHFAVFDTEAETYEFVANPNNIFIQLRYDDKAASDDPKVIGEDAFVKIRVINKTNVAKYNRYLNEVYQHNPADVRIIDNDMLIDDNADVALNVDDLDVAIMKYVDNSSVENKEQLKQYMVSLYNRALAMESRL